MTLLDFLAKHGLTIIMGIIFPIFWFVMNATFAKKTELEAEKRRITTLEGTVSGLPSSKDFAQLDKSLETFGGEIKAINTDIAYLRKNVDLLVQLEMKRDKNHG